MPLPFDIQIREVPLYLASELQENPNPSTKGSLCPEESVLLHMLYAEGQWLQTWVVSNSAGDYHSWCTQT